MDFVKQWKRVAALALKKTIRATAAKEVGKEIPAEETTVRPNQILFVENRIGHSAAWQSG
jgi:hypothetical protein